MYVAVTNTDVRNRSLRARLQNYCKRTLRSQVTEYVRYTNRIALLQEYSPSKAEEELYNGISAYLQTENYMHCQKANGILLQWCFENCWHLHLCN